MKGTWRFGFGFRSREDWVGDQWRKERRREKEKNCSYDDDAYKYIWVYVYVYILERENRKGLWGAQGWRRHQNKYQIIMLKFNGTWMSQKS